MKRVAAPTQPLTVFFSVVIVAVALLLAGCNADTLSGPDFDQEDAILSLRDGGKHESRNENGATSDDALGGKHESRNENGAVGGKHESRNENGATSDDALGGKHESRNENGAAGGKHESRNENG